MVQVQKMHMNILKYRCKVKFVPHKKILITSDDDVFEDLRVEWLLHECGENCLVKHNFSCKLKNKILDKLLKHAVKKQVQYTIDAFCHFLQWHS